MTVTFFIRYFLFRCHLLQETAGPAPSFVSCLFLSGFWALDLAFPHTVIPPAVAQSYPVNRSFSGHSLILHLMTHGTSLIFCFLVAPACSLQPYSLRPPLALAQWLNSYSVYMSVRNPCGQSALCLFALPCSHPSPHPAVSLSNNRCTVGVY